MFITKIEISNFKAFSEKVTLNLRPNINGIEKDLERNYFIKKNNNYMSTINAIGGTNSSGKSTFIQSIVIVKKYFSNHSTRYALDKFVKNKIEQDKIEQDNLKKKKKREENPFTSMLEEIISYREYVENNKPPDASSKSILSLREEVINETYIENASLENKDIIISITFIDKSNKEIVLNYKMNKNNEIISFVKNKIKITKNSKKTEIRKEFKILEKLFTTFFTKSIKVYDDQNTFNESYHFTNRDIDFILDKLGKEKVLSILSFLDYRIIDFTTVELGEKKKKTIKEIIIELNGGAKRKLVPYNLSGGSKIFLFYFAKFLGHTKDKNSIIFIDEIEVGLHYSLVEFLKYWIQKINGKETTSQLFFTSHNIFALANNLSLKQIFFLENDIVTDKTRFVKASSNTKPKNSIYKKYFEGKIGSHPNEIQADEVLDLLMEEIL